jgi:hypothetical protein
MVADRQAGRGGRYAPRWLDQPRGEAFLISVEKLPLEDERTQWPSWLAPAPALGRTSTARSGARRSAGSRRPKPSQERDDDPRLPPGIPAPAGA